MQGSSRKGGPEIQAARSAQQQAQQAESISRLQEQLEASQKALEQERAAAQKLEQVQHVLANSSLEVTVEGFRLQASARQLLTDQSRLHMLWR